VPGAVAAAKARYNLETRMGNITPELSMALRAYIVALAALMPAAPPPAPPPVLPTAQAGPAAPIAPPPVQVTPSITPPPGA
jgi:hypothetical protein